VYLFGYGYEKRDRIATSSCWTSSSFCAFGRKYVASRDPAPLLAGRNSLGTVDKLSNEIPWNRSWLSGRAAICRQSLDHLLDWRYWLLFSDTIYTRIQPDSASFTRKFRIKVPHSKVWKHEESFQCLGSSQNFLVFPTTLELLPPGPEAGAAGAVCKVEELSSWS
jgi:hypothetical protein